MTNSDPVVLVTGCSSGIGRATAELLAQSGFRVGAGVRDPRHADELRDAKLPRLEPILLDVTNDDQVADAVARLRSFGSGGLAGLINNAGVGLPAAVELSSPDEVRQLLEVNTIGSLRMIQACLPLLRQYQGPMRARVINISSMNGTISMPMVGAYSASKFALEAISDALRVELRPWQISVSVIRPGQVRTPIFSKAAESLVQRQREIPDELRSGYDPMYSRAIEFNQRGANSSTSPEMVAQTVLRAMKARRPRTYYLVGNDARALQWMNSLVPKWLIDRVFARVMHLPAKIRQTPKN